MITKIGRNVLWAMIALAVIFAVLALTVSPWWWLGELIFVPLTLVGLHDITQKKHAITSNYPIIGHLRFILEDMGPELHQYLVENNTDGAPFNRDHRSIIYERAKGVTDTKPFGTEQNVYAVGYAFLKHSIATRPVTEDPVRDRASRSAEPTASSRTRSRCSTSRP